MANFFQRLTSLFSSKEPAKKMTDATFADLVEAFTERCQKWPVGKIVQASNPQRFGVLVTPWLSATAPFFSLECAMLIKRTGHIPVIFYDDTDLAQGPTDPNHAALLLALITEQFAGWEIRMAEQARPQSYVSDITLAGPIFRENSIWRARGALRAEGFMADNPAASARITNHVGQVRGLIASANLDRLFVPGGIFGLSAIYVALSRELGIPFTTYDGSPGLLRMSQNGVAAHLSDIPQAFAHLANHLDTQKREKVAAAAKAELEDRMQSRDYRRYQSVPITGNADLSYDIVIPLNIRWDSVALGRQLAFKNATDWLESVLNWVSEHPDIKVCIRQHPREPRESNKKADTLAPLLARFASLGNRLRFVAADEPVNTYDLIRQARVVLPHSSTAGVEAVLLNKPVVLSAACYYENLGFCSKAANRSDYFAFVSQALDGGLPISPTQRDDAALAYYLSQRCALIRTCLTAHKEDFLEWVQTPPDKLWAQAETLDLRSALITGEPLSLVRHRRLSQAQPH